MGGAVWSEVAGGGWMGVLMVVAGMALPTPALGQSAPVWFRGGAYEAGVTDTEGVERLGGLAWTFETGGAVRGSPSVVNGTVYVGSSDGYLYALDAEAGRLRWRYDGGSAMGGTPLVTADRVVAVGRGNVVHAVDRRTGRSLWRTGLGRDLPLEWGYEGWDYILPSAVPVEDAVLVGSGDGHLYALDPSDGSTRWRFATRGRIRGTPAVVDGVAYVGSGDGYVYGVDVRDGSERWRFETAGVSLDAEQAGFDRTQIQATPVVVDGILYVGSRDASLYAIELASGEVAWTFEDGSSWVVNSPAYHDGVVFSGRSSSGRVRAVDATNGQEVWAHQTRGLVFSSPVVADGMVYVGSGDGRIYALSVTDGTPAWSFPTGDAVMGTPAVWGRRVFVGSDDGVVYALEAASGRSPRRAVFWDDALASRSSVGGSPDHRRMTTHFENRGYEVLDSAGVEAFLRSEIDLGPHSVVVFGMDGAPTTVVDPADPAGSLLRRYLDAGGKVVWPGVPPLLLLRGEDGAVTGVDRGLATQVVGVDHAAWNDDQYPVDLTPDGRRWGLERGWVGNPSVATTEATTVLAVTELGVAAAWVRSFGHGEGTGWVVVPATLAPARLEDMRRVAEYGIFRRPTSDP